MKRKLRSNREEDERQRREGKAAADEGRVALRGALWKRGQFNMLSWQERFFVLRRGGGGAGEPCELEYFDGEGGARKGVVDLGGGGGCGGGEERRHADDVEASRSAGGAGDGDEDAAALPRIVIVPESSTQIHATKWRFSVTTADRTLLLAAHSHNEMMEWLEALRGAVC